MNMKHTPGPWSIATTPGSSGGIAHDKGYVAFTAAPRKVSDERADGESWLDMRNRTEPDRELIKSEEFANARLIAAAPELLEALRACLQCFDEMKGRKPAFVEDSIAMSKEAIAKATGAAP